MLGQLLKNTALNSSSLMEQELKLSTVTAYWEVLLWVALGKTVMLLTLTEITGIQRQKFSETQPFLIQGRT